MMIPINKAKSSLILFSGISNHNFNLIPSYNFLESISNKEHKKNKNIKINHHQKLFPENILELNTKIKNIQEWFNYWKNNWPINLCYNDKQSINLGKYFYDLKLKSIYQCQAHYFQLKPKYIILETNYLSNIKWIIENINHTKTLIISDRISFWQKTSFKIKILTKYTSKFDRPISIINYQNLNNNSIKKHKWGFVLIDIIDRPTKNQLRYIKRLESKFGMILVNKLSVNNYYYLCKLSLTEIVDNKNIHTFFLKNMIGKTNIKPKIIKTKLKFNKYEEMIYKKSPQIRTCENPLPFNFKNNKYNLNKYQQNDNECFICLENINNKCELPCKHIGCFECTIEYLSSSNSNINKCPICRREFNIKNLLIELKSKLIPKNTKLTYLTSNKDINNNKTIIVINNKDIYQKVDATQATIIDLSTYKKYKNKNEIEKIVVVEVDILKNIDFIELYQEFLNMNSNLLLEIIFIGNTAEEEFLYTNNI